MHTPIPWDDDPECGHKVAHPFQTHYCTYERVPRLLSLENSLTDQPDEIWALRLLQAYELWFLVMARDLENVLDAIQGQPTDRDKHLRRCDSLVRLLEQQTDIAGWALVEDLGVQLPLRPSGPATPSPGFNRVRSLTGRLRRKDAGQAGRQYVRRFAEWAPRFERLLARLLSPDPEAADYETYVRIQELSSLQTGVKGNWSPVGTPPDGISPTDPVSADELMFIVVHQAFELWFNLILHELDAIRELLASQPALVGEAARRMRRVVAAQKLLIDQIHIPRTMHPLDFLQFRHETRVRDGVTYERGLSPASGTESYQFREIEIIGGVGESKGYREFLHGNEAMHIRFLTPAHQRRLEQPDLPELFQNLLKGRGVGDVIEIFKPAGAENPHAELAELADLLLEFDQFFQVWRVNHLVMVESMIGRKSGTGFLGPEYLEETVGMGQKSAKDRLLTEPQRRPRFFEELWKVRTRFQAVPEAEDA